MMNQLIIVFELFGSVQTHLNSCKDEETDGRQTDRKSSSNQPTQPKRQATDGLTAHKTNNINPNQYKITIASSNLYAHHG
jgi:hypothetical protein